MDSDRLQYEKKLKATKVSSLGGKIIFKHGLPFCEQSYKKNTFQLEHDNKYIIQVHSVSLKLETLSSLEFSVQPKAWLTGRDTACCFCS